MEPFPAISYLCPGRILARRLIGGLLEASDWPGRHGSDARARDRACMGHVVHLSCPEGSHTDDMCSSADSIGDASREKQGETVASRTAGRYRAGKGSHDWWRGGSNGVIPAVGEKRDRKGMVQQHRQQCRRFAPWPEPFSSARCVGLVPRRSRQRMAQQSETKSRPRP